MSTKRTVEIFTAGCPLCEEAVATVQRVACDSCDVTVYDLNEESAAQRAAALGVRSVPAVVVDGRLADCCRGGGVTEEGLRAAGIGQTA
jgi:glutaredoxin